MTNSRTGRIGRAFGAAASHYDEFAQVHRRAARRVSEVARGLDPRTTAAIVEIGCGTGLLTRELVEVFPAARLIATDLSADMVARARALCGGQGRVSFARMDGEHPDLPAAAFDLVTSSLAFQWFADLPAALPRLVALLRPGGTLLFATMAERSFAEWRSAHARHGARAGTPEYPSLAALRDLLAPHGAVELTEEEHVVTTGGAHGLHRHLKGIGATVPAEGHSPLPPGLARQVMASFDATGGNISYHIAYGRVTRPD